MKKCARLIPVILLAGFLRASATAIAVQDLPPEKSIGITVFDVSDLPARIDEPKLEKVGEKYILNCTIANRYSEQLLGIRLIVLVIDRSGKLRSRMTWAEATEMAAYSIRSFAFHPTIKDDIRGTDQLFLGADEVIGYETIWQAVGAEKALRAYSRGQHDVTPKVRTVENKFDRPADILKVPIRY
jgi:hypothetical protein